MNEWIWMCSLPGFYRKDFEKLLRCFASPRQLYQAEEKQIMQCPFLNDRQKTVLNQWKKKNPEEIRHKLEKSRIKFISCEQAEYPEQLRQMPDYPYGLFYLGKLPEKGERCVAVVGARMCTNYGRNLARNIAEELADHQIALVSGMAYGIDGIAQSASLHRGGRSFALTGCGPDICYPKEHKELYLELEKRGGIISEYPPGTPVKPFHFPMRNRLISAFCECVIVIEAKKKSGTLITADMALEQGRDVLAVPGRIGDPLSEGCNHLISQGAGILTSMEELENYLGIPSQKEKKSKKNNITLASLENMVYICLDFRPKSLTELVTVTKLSPEKVMSILTELQMKGLAEEVYKNYYALKR